MASAIDKKRDGKRPFLGMGSPKADDGEDLKVSIGDRMPKPKPKPIEQVNVAAAVSELLKKAGAILFPDRVAFQSQKEPNLFVTEPRVVRISDGDAGIIADMRTEVHRVSANMAEVVYKLRLTDEELEIVKPVIKRWGTSDRMFIGMSSLVKLVGV